MLSLEDAAKIGYKFEECVKGLCSGPSTFASLYGLYHDLTNQREETDTKGA